MQNNVQIPDAIKEFAKSAEIFDVCEKIGAKFNLLIDQVSELDSEIRSVLLGINKSSDFTEHIAQRLEVNRDIAGKITEEVNNQVFKVLRTKIQDAGSMLEKIVVAPQDPKPTHVADLEKAGGFTIEDESAPIVHEAYKEPLADHLITGVGLKQKEKTATIVTNSQAPANLPTADNYEVPRNTQPAPVTTASPTPVVTTSPSPSQNTAPTTQPKSNWPDAYREPI